MLIPALAHAGQPVTAHDLAGAWNLEPVLLLSLAGAAWVYARGGRTGRGRQWWRPWCFAAGLLAAAVALVSPVDTAASALASAHMVQHILLFLVAAPLLAVSAAWLQLLRGSPAALRRAALAGHRRVHGRPVVAVLRRPSVAWLAHVGTIWIWHASAPYGAALRHDAVHAVEHATFLLTGVWFWSVVAGRRSPVSAGYGLLLVFAMATQSVLLSALITFAGTPWYPAYETTAPAFGLDPLTDQQLAGAIMWVPANAVYLVAALTLLVAWIREGDPDRRHRPLAAAR